MTRSSLSRLHDLLAACDAIGRHVKAEGVDEGILFDAIRIRLVEVGEAVKGLDPGLTETEPEIPWADIARMRDHLAHRYFDTSIHRYIDTSIHRYFDAEHAIVFETAHTDIPLLAAAVHRILKSLDS